MKAFMAPSLACIPLLLSAQTTASQNSQRPNIIFILADDLGWNDLSCMGSQFYETPNIDQIAQRGTRFTNAYAACQVSSPSRASILTGKYTTQHGITDWIGEAYGENWRRLNRHNKLLPAQYKMQLDSSEYTLAAYLRDQGYTTFIAGKWHLGDKGSTPETHGFTVNVGGWRAGSPEGGYFSPYKNPKLPDGPKGENLSMRLAQETVDFIKEQQKQKKPFFAYLSFYAVHCPIQTTQERWQKYQRKAKAQGLNPTAFAFDRTQPVRTVQDNPVYAGLIEQMDTAVGKVLDALKDLGLDKNTIIVFTSDNGGVVSGDDFSTSLFPLRGGKGRQWEGGIRVPVLIDVPSLSGRQVKVADTPISGIDFYPTLLSLASLKPSDKQALDGVDFSPLLTGENIAARPLFWHYPHYGNQGGEPSSIIRDGEWKLIYYHEDKRLELYNLAIDLGEHEPLNIQYPEKLEELKSKLFSWLEETKAIMPTADLLYKPQEEHKVKVWWKGKRMQALEKQRLETLQDHWQPNTDWWSSKIVND